MSLLWTKTCGVVLEEHTWNSGSGEHCAFSGPNSGRRCSVHYPFRRGKWSRRRLRRRRHSGVKQGHERKSRHDRAVSGGISWRGCRTTAVAERAEHAAIPLFWRMHALAPGAFPEELARTYGNLGFSSAVAIRTREQSHLNLRSTIGTIGAQSALSTDVGRHWTLSSRSRTVRIGQSSAAGRV